MYVNFYERIAYFKDTQASAGRAIMHRIWYLTNGFGPVYTLGFQLYVWFRAVKIG